MVQKNVQKKKEKTMKQIDKCKTIGKFDMCKIQE